MVLLLVGYCVLVIASSVVGGWLPLMVRLTHTRMQLAISFVSGAMLGVGLLHLLPHAVFELRGVSGLGEPVDAAVAWMLGGFLAMFLIERCFHSHQHEPPEAISCQDPEHASEPIHPPHAHDHEHDHHAAGQPRTAWIGAAVGLTLHSTIDGLALAAAVGAEARHGHLGLLAGLGTFFVVFLHKPFDSMTLSTLMTAGGWSRGACHVVNALYALAVPLGVLFYHFGESRFSDAFLGYALAFAAGTFLCIATSDLLPELQFHSHDRVKLSLALAAGLAMAVLLGYFEGEAHHGHGHAPHAHGTGHDHEPRPYVRPAGVQPEE